MSEITIRRGIYLVSCDVVPYRGKATQGVEVARVDPCAVLLRGKASRGASINAAMPPLGPCEVDLTALPGILPPIVANGGVTVKVLFVLAGDERVRVQYYVRGDY